MKTKEDWIKLLNQLDDESYVAFVDTELGNFYTGDIVESSFCKEDNIYYLDIGKGIITQQGIMVEEEFPEHDNVVTLY